MTRYGKTRTHCKEASPNQITSGPDNVRPRSYLHHPKLAKPAAQRSALSTQYSILSAGYIYRCFISNPFRYRSLATKHAESHVSGMFRPVRYNVRIESKLRSVRLGKYLCYLNANLLAFIDLNHLCRLEFVVLKDVTNELSFPYSRHYDNTGGSYC